MNPPPSPTFWAKTLKKKTTTLPSKILNSPFGFKKYFVRANFFSHPLTFKLVPTGLRAFTSLQCLRLVSWVVHLLSIRVVHLLLISTSRRKNLGTSRGIPVGRGGGGGTEHSRENWVDQLSPFLRQKWSISLPCLSQGVPHFMTMILKRTRHESHEK